MLEAIDASGHVTIQRESWHARLMDPDQESFEEFSIPPQVLYKYPPAHRLDHVLPEAKPCSFRATPPSELSDINEINYRTAFVDDDSNRERINGEYALTLTELFPTSQNSVDDVQTYKDTRNKASGVWCVGAAIGMEFAPACKQSAIGDG